METEQQPALYDNFTKTLYKIAAIQALPGEISPESFSGGAFGSLGGWNISADKLYSGSGSLTVGFDRKSTSADDVRIYAGASDPASAPFLFT